MGRVATAAVAVACGIAGACLYLTVLLGTPGALILVYMTQLPLFVAGLWLGSGAAVIAGATGTLILFAESDFLGAAIFAALNAVPVAVLVRQALLARPDTEGRIVWYPPGLLTAWLTGLGLAGIAGAVVLLGGPEGLQSATRGVIAEVLDRISRRGMPNSDQVAATLALVIPGVIAASWMMMSAVNAALAQGLLARFGASWRPSPDLAELGLPIWLAIALGLAAAMTIFEGGARFIGINMTIALLVPFCLAGLAVLHVAVRRLSHPAMVLVAFYTISALFGWPLLVVTVLGLLESWLGLRHRLAPKGASIDG